MIDVLWRQDVDLGAGREVFNYSNRAKESEGEKAGPRPSKDGNQERWRNGLNLQPPPPPPVDGETGESIPEQVCGGTFRARFGLRLRSRTDAVSSPPPPQLPGIGSQTSLSLQECLRLLEATFPFGEESEVR